MSSFPFLFIKYIFQVILCVYFIVYVYVAAEKNEENLNIESAVQANVNNNGAAMAPDAKVEAAAKAGFLPAFVASFSVIIVSELGDKTFFIAAIMAMRYPRLTVFAGAITALILMTILSVGFGWMTKYVPRSYTYYVSTALLAIFGIKMLRDAYYMSPNEGKEELEEVQSDLRNREDEYEMDSMLPNDVESGVSRRCRSFRFSVLKYIPRIFLQTFTLTFLAEWGDRSQFTTILLAARESVLGVSVGGVLGHSMCTGLAVIGGRIIAQKISVRTVTFIGGVVFLIFAITAFFTPPGENLK